MYLGFHLFRFCCVTITLKAVLVFWGGGGGRVLNKNKLFISFVVSRWEDNIKMDLQEVGGGCGDWMELAQDRDRWRALVSTVMNVRVPKKLGIS